MKITKVDINNILLGFVGVILSLCLILALINKKNVNEGFTDEVDDELLAGIKDNLDDQKESELKDTISKLKQRLVNYGFMPDSSDFIRKTEMGPDTGKCVVSKAEDRDKYIAKSSVPAPGPRVDLSQYVKKTAIPPEKVCPPQKEIDYSAYVKKSSLPPKQECPPCIAPKVKVSAGLCQKCPPCPVCPPPKRCPEKECPEVKPCPPAKQCPPPQPCPTLGEQKSCAEIKYIKVPTVITKVIKVDNSGNVLSKSIETDSPDITEAPTTTQSNEIQSNKTYSNETQSNKIYSNKTYSNETQSVVIQPEPTEDYKLPTTTKPQKCKLSALNSAFSSNGIPGYNLM